MRKFNARLFVLFLSVIVYNSHGQSVRASSFGFEIDPTRAMVLAMKSDNDTIIIDKKKVPWTVKPVRIIGVSNKVILFESETQVHAQSGAFMKTTDALLTFVKCENIQIIGNGSTLCMNKEEYLDGEWRHGISLRAAKDFSIRDLTIRDSGGDGIYIAGSERGTYSENVFIDNVQSLNNKRQGLSIISGKNITISNSLFADTKGTLPGAGLDIEPNNAEDVVSQIEINKCVFRNNDHSGIKLALGKLEDWSTPVSIYVNDCILENNHSKDHPKTAAEILIGAHKNRPVKGEVIFQNCLIKNSNWGLFYSRKRADAYTVKFIDCVGKNICQDGNWPPVFLEVPDYRKKTAGLGGFIFENLYLDYDTPVPFMIVRGSRFGTLENLQNINGDVTINSPGTEDFKFINYSKSSNLNVNIQVTRENK